MVDGELGLSFSLEGLDDLMRKFPTSEKVQVRIQLALKRAGLRLVRGIGEALQSTSQGGTRQLMRSLQVLEADTTHVKVGTNLNYGLWVNDGTGVFGPTGSPIVPVNARVLHWVGEDGDVFRPSVQGQPGKHFMEEGLKNSKSGVQEEVSRAFEDVLG